ncbi:class I SAM-dependent methyltransferase [Stigmatella sp. ncwal1]|uniref:Class I SAM-dependent methyltransferase n=1 Tax=Stigmatella ashevillensis TaxID=2995309 RepID=A0ABT5DIW3_9BACT|nr:class I SAM-dependent methyltransferase [Stigmatella ashevillena]MDC0713466.1 class I SAM-dependent methyltransferase [Stigmatella ashevillena]
MLNLLDMPRQALRDARARLSKHPFVNTLRSAMPAGLRLSSPAPDDPALADAERVEAYRKAIGRYVKPGQVVMDVGAGMGLRTLLAAHRGPRRLYAVDPSRHLDTARWVARRHGLADNIDFVREDSGRFTPSEKKVDVLLHEQTGPSLFDAGLVPRLVSLRNRLLRPGGRILPHRFEVFIEPVQLRDEACLPFIWSQSLPSVDFSCLKTLREAMNPAYFTRLVRAYEVAHLLCEPEPVFSFDLETMKPGELPRHIHFQRAVAKPGRLDGFCVFYRAAFDAETSFSVSPERGHNPSSLMLLRVDAREYSRSQTLRLDLELPDLEDVTSWRWRFE